MDDDLVHLGVWRDYSAGKYTGWILTTTILERKDAMIREQEVILRNSESDLCPLTNVGCLIWAWRSFGHLLPGDKLRESNRSSVILLFVSLAHWIFFLFLAASLPSLLSKGQPNPVVLLNSDSCVPYLAEEQEMSRFWSIESTQVRKEIMTFIRGLVHRSGFKNIVSKRGSDILSIKRYGLGYERQSDIPPHQWEREARVWFGTSVAKIQVSVMTKAFGSLSKRRRAIYTRGNYTGKSSGHRHLLRDLYCHQLRMRSAQHTTISMLGLCCCLGIGSLIWLISSLGGLWMRRLFIYQPHRVLAWELDSAMQLIRQLHEHLQRGIWTTSDLHSVPLAFNTLGVATLYSNGTRYIPAYKIPRLGCSDNLPHTVTSIPRSERIRIIGHGWEDWFITLGLFIWKIVSHRRLWFPTKLAATQLTHLHSSPAVSTVYYIFFKLSGANGPA
ncbi:MAG: hypothetical protein Q9210_003634 [Variospora velana]